jgi:hypothetical protein
MGETSAPDYRVTNKAYEIEVGGDVYKVRKPKFKEHREMLKKVKDAEAEDAADVTLENLKALGMPDDLESLLDIDDILEISTIVMGGKKK